MSAILSSVASQASVDLPSRRFVGGADGETDSASKDANSVLGVWSWGAGLGAADSSNGKVESFDSSKGKVEPLPL